MNRVWTIALFGLVILPGHGEEQKGVLEPGNRSVFLRPEMTRSYAELQARIMKAFREKDYPNVEKMLRRAIELAPNSACNYYNLACARALQAHEEDALQCLEKAVGLGFLNVTHILSDRDLFSLHDNPSFKQIVERARQFSKETFLPWDGELPKSMVKDRVALVSEENTVWDYRNRVFRSSFIFPDEPGEREIIRGHGKVGELLKKWYAEGTAAGNHGDLYDNHDNDHSNMAYGNFPQLTRIEYCQEAKALQLSTGLQVRFFYNCVTIGNSSTAITSGPFWRSQPRLAYTNPRATTLLYVQYARNHLYCYPEHRDHDPAKAGEGGHGDVYPANTPYVVISQGSSGSDRPFLDAIACTLAAFRPEVKLFLARHGALMPAVQMILRWTSRLVKDEKEYLTGKAHPTVFSSKNLDTLKMVSMAHEMTLAAVPPLAELEVIEEDLGVPGRDYFDIGQRERLFDTPCAIARVYRTLRHSRRMVVSAARSRDLNGLELKWFWVVLRGDAASIKIKPLKPDGSVVELVIPYHTRRPVTPGSTLESDRVDIGVFVHNGRYFSAPAFITHYFLANEKRVYDPSGRILVVDYTDPDVRKAYVDPAIDFRKNWRDDFIYSKDGQLLGWTRTIGKDKFEFTARGKLVLERDRNGNVKRAAEVSYRARQTGKRGPGIPELFQVIKEETQ